ncbi:MAG TPA: hypothetical protein VF518_14220 [Polyangia bacterium]
MTDSLDRWAAHAPDSIDWDRRGHACQACFVQISDGRPVAVSEPEKENHALPSQIKLIPRRGEAEFAGRRHWVGVEDGYLVGFDAGEFGGSTWWFSADGAHRRKLSLPAADQFPENVHGFASLGKDVLAFEGLVHMGFNVGRVTRIRRVADREWRPSRFVDLGACPLAIIQESESAWLAAITSGILRIDGQARVNPVWLSPGGHGFYPNSLVRDEAGVVYLGTGGPVVRLTPERDDTYAVHLLTPPAK